MPAWWTGGATVTLYHGTSCALLPTIERAGLQPPALDTAALSARLRALAPDAAVPATASAELLRAVQHGRDGARARRIYTLPAPAFDRAAGYARSYAEDGGELARILRQGLAARLGRAIAPAHPGAGGVVLEIEAPRAAVTAFRDLDELASRVRTAWRTGEDWTRGFPDLAALFAEISDFETLLDGPVPRDWITAVHDLSGG